MSHGDESRHTQLLGYTFRLLFYDESETVAMDIDDLDIRIIFEILAQFGYEDIHGARSKIVVFTPDLCQRLVACQYVIQVQAKEPEEVCFFW